MPRRSLLETFDAFYRRGRETAIVQPRGYRWERWSYRQTADAACRLARELEAGGIGRGQRVLLWGENSAEWVAAFWGILLRGAVVVPMDRIAAPDFARRVCEEVDARLVVGGREQVQLAPEAPALAFEDFSSVLARHAPDLLLPPQAERADTVEIVFTSGTTAEPRGVVITHGNILSNLEPIETEIQKYLKYERWVHPLRFLNLLPLSHVFGQFLGLFVAPLLGATVVFSESLSPGEVIRIFKREKVSVLVSVPRVLESLKEKLERDAEAAGEKERFRRRLAAAEGEGRLKRWWRFRSVHRRFGLKFWAFVSGGAALVPEVETFWGRLGFAVIQGYGLTETTSLISVNHPFRLSKGSIGKVLPGRELKLSESGEILVRGGGVAAGYWHGRRFAPVEGEEGWFHTGDLGALDAEGNLYFKGRQKNVIVTPEGMNVYPEDLEAALRRQPEVRDAVVVGLQRDGNAEPCAVLLLRENASPEATIERANRSLADYQKIRRWLAWPETDFPRTSTQKPRANLVQAWAEQQAAAAGAAAPAGPLAEILARVTRRAPPLLSPAARLDEDLSLSSLERVGLMSELEDRFQVELDETRFTGAATVAELEQMLRQPVPKLRERELHYPRWARRWLVHWLRLTAYYLAVWPVTHLLASPRVRGRENLRGVKGPVLVVANHTSIVDVGFVLAVLPARLRHRLAVSVQAEELEAMRRGARRRGVLGNLLDPVGYWLAVALFHVFPLPRQSGFRESFRFAGELTDAGWSVLVFPEGEFTPDGCVMPFRAGIGLLAKNLGVPVVPLRIEGVFELKKAGKRWAPPGKVKVTIGAPLRFASSADPAEIACTLEESVKRLGQRKSKADPSLRSG
jgi:long-chain acyl-CoA synthetase